MKTVRFPGLPASLRDALAAQRKKRGWSQAELGTRAGLPQMHISGIETGKVAPRYDTLLNLVRILDYDLILVPRNLVPAVQALVRDSGNPEAEEGEERALYADQEDETNP